MKHLLFYNDAPEFGGHEVLTLEAVKFLSGCNVRIGFMYFRGNKRLAARLEEMKDSMGGSIDLYPLEVCSSSFQCVRTRMLVYERRKLQKMILDIHPDLMVVSQGTIEISSLGLVVAKAAEMRTISYLPFAHKMSAMQVPLGTFRDSINKYFYSLPDKFITSSNRMKELLIEHGVPGERVTVAFNGINLNKLKQGDRLSLRRQYGIEGGGTVVALVGRVLFKQKGHDFLIDTLSRFREELGSFQFLIVGDGPDKKKLERMIVKNNLEDIVHCIPWQADVSRIYPMIDILVIPSLFEGVPVVMQEAMYYKVPIVGARIDGLVEFLPEDWMFTPRDSESFMQTLLRVLHTNNSGLLESNKQLIERNFSLADFGQRFYDVVLETLNVETEKGLP